MANEIAEKLFEAVDILASAKISNLQYDKTLICTIESISNAQKGEYKVTDGSSHFLAYSENTKYTEGTRVYVNVPNGDMGNQKIITGKYVSSDTDEYYPYVPPLDDFIDITNNLINQNLSYSLLANDPDEKEIVIWELRNLNYKNYNRLGISAEFQTWLAQLNANSGSYGLRLDVVSKGASGANEFFSFYLDTSDMYGNPYNFGTYYKQEKLFDISMLTQIIQMRLIMYQNENFTKQDGTAVEYIENGVKLSDNIFMQNVYVALGYSLEDFTEDKVILNTNDPLSYKNGGTPKERNIYMRWVHNINDKFYSIDEEEEIPENAIIHWYRYKLEQDREDELAGIFWKEISVEDKFNYTFIPDYDTQNDMFKVIIEYPSREYIANNLTINEDLNNNLTKIQVINNDKYPGIRNAVYRMCSLNDIDEINKVYDDTLAANAFLNDTNYLSSILNIILEEKAKIIFYTSDVLQFTNEISQDLVVMDLIKGLSLECDEDGYKGVYRIYDDTNSIMNSTEASKSRTIKAKYSSVITGEKKLDMAEEITWYIPVQNTMIEEPLAGKEYNTSNGDIYMPLGSSGMDGYAAIRRKGTEIAGVPEDGIQLIETNQTFRIKNYYVQSATNNTIYCSVRKNGRDYETSTTLAFGTTGANGTDATFLLKMYEADGKTEVSALTLGGSVFIKPFLYDYNNELVDISSKTIRYSWYSSNSANSISIVNGPNLNGNDELQIRSNSNNITNHEFYILKADIPWTITTDINESGGTTNREITLTAFLPIAVRSNRQYAQLEGTIKIVYDMNGANPSYYKKPYKLYRTNNLTPVNAVWHAKSNDFINDPSARRYYPSLLSTGELTPVNMYYTGLQPFCVYATVGGTYVWTQPILIIQNRYSSAMLNNWSGNLTINEKNGIILSSIVGAGIKEDDNSFSGVLLGDVDKASNGKTGIGLYGFQKGEQSYGFNVDGTAFIGRSGKGRINFDGNKGTITSGNYLENNSGIQIDLDDAKLNAYGTAGGYEMNMNAAAGKPLLLIKDKSNHNLLYISGNTEGSGDQATKYYIQSSNYSSTGKRGIRLDLEKSQLFAYGPGGSIKIDASSAANLFKISSASNNPLINVANGSGQYYIRSDNFVNNQKGLNIDINNGIIQIYGVDSSNNASGNVLIKGNGDPYFRIQTRYNNSNVNLFYVSKNDLYLQSRDFNTATRTGTKINLSSGRMDSYSFTIRAHGSYNSSTGEQVNGDIIIDSTASRYPLSIGSNFLVDWGGNITARSITVVGGRLGGWYIDSNGIYDYNPNSAGEKSGVAIISNGLSSDRLLRIAVGDFTIKEVDVPVEGEDGGTSTEIGYEANGRGFNVKSDGSMNSYSSNFYSSTIESAKINDATIKRGTITSATIKGNCKVSGTLSGGKITGSTISSGTIDGAKITGGSIDISGRISCEGLTIGGKPYTPHTMKGVFAAVSNPDGSGTSWRVLNSYTTLSKTLSNNINTGGSADIAMPLENAYVMFGGNRYPVEGGRCILAEHHHTYKRNEYSIDGSYTNLTRKNLNMDVLAASLSGD